MKMEITKREKILLLVLALLIIGLAYFKFVLSPINDRIGEYQSNIQEEQTTITAAQPQMAKLNKMQTELKKLKADGTSNTIPEYDNARGVMDELHMVLASAANYSLSFDGVKQDGGIVRRPIYMTFTTSTYEQARGIVNRLNDGTYVSQISDLSITQGEENYETQLTITYFEIAD